MLALIWFLTVIGVLFKVFFVHRFKIISTIAYILMGWLVIVAIKPLFRRCPEVVLRCLSVVEWPIRWEQYFMHGKNFHLIMRFGIYLFLPAAFVISAPLFFTSFRLKPKLII